MRAARKGTKAFAPLRFAPGEAVQIDWGEATAYLNGKKMVVNLFRARLCHSCAPYVIAYKRQEFGVPSGCYDPFLPVLPRRPPAYDL